MKLLNAFFLGLCFITKIALAHPSNELRIQVLDARIESDPNNAALLVLRAREHIHDRHWRLAEADLRQAEKLTSPEFVAYDYGHLYLAQEELIISRRYFEQHLNTSSSNIYETLWQLGNIEIAMDNHAKAIEYFSLYISDSHTLHPGNIVKSVRTAQEAGLLGTAQELVELGIQRVGSVPQLLRLKHEVLANSNQLKSEEAQN